MKKNILYCFVFLLTSSILIGEEVTRVYFDIGSGATKVIAAKVDINKKKIADVLYTKSFPVAYESDLLKGGSNKFSKQIIAEGLKVLKQAYNETAIYKPDAYYGTATAAFRKAINAKEILGYFSKHLNNIPLVAIPQRLEGKLGYLEGLIEADEIGRTIVWDIGGGSFQIGSYAPEEPKLFNGTIASAKMQEITEQIALKSDAFFYPISEEEVEASLDNFYSLINKTPNYLSQLALSIDTVVIGVGSVHSNANLLVSPKTNSYNINELRDFILESVSNENRSFQNWNGPFKRARFTNLILLYGFMKKINIEEVYVSEVPTGSGALLYTPFWKDNSNQSLNLSLK